MNKRIKIVSLLLLFVFISNITSIFAFASEDCMSENFGMLLRIQ